MAKIVNALLCILYCLPQQQRE